MITHTPTYKGILFILEKEGNSAICTNMDKPGGHYDSTFMRFLK